VVRPTPEVYWLGYWLPRLDDSGFFPAGTAAFLQLFDETADLVREGVLQTNPGTKYPLTEIQPAAAAAESIDHNGKVFLVPSSPR